MFGIGICKLSYFNMSFLIRLILNLFLFLFKISKTLKLNHDWLIDLGLIVLFPVQIFFSLAFPPQKLKNFISCQPEIIFWNCW